MVTPELPDREVIRSWVRFEEVSATKLDTCTFSLSGLISIGDDKWASGCVPHELGHAACAYLGGPSACPDFEHVGRKIGC